MKRFRIALMAATLLAAGPALADPPPHAGPPGGYGPPGQVKKHHNKGEKLDREHWGEQVDYRQYKLRAPPAGHEWRRVDDDYVLLSINTGIISSVISIGN